MEPADTVIDNKLRWRFWISLACTVSFVIWMRYYLLPFQSRDVVQFEMAKTIAKASLLIDSWNETGKMNLALKSIYIDFVFIVIYCFAINAACRFISILTKNNILVKAGFFFSYLIFLAGIFDLVENFAMINSLTHTLTQSGVSLAHKMAISKFSIILMSLFFIAVCIMFWLLNIIPRKDTSWNKA